MTSTKWVDLGKLTVKPGMNRTNTAGDKAGRDLRSALHKNSKHSATSLLRVKIVR